MENQQSNETRKPKLIDQVRNKKNAAAAFGQKYGDDVHCLLI